MALLKMADGRELLVKNLSTAKVMHVQELQRQSGLKMADIHTTVAEADVTSMVVLSFLTQRTAGIPINWDDLIEGSTEDLGTYVSEPGDKKPEDKEETDPPQSAQSDSELDAEPGETPPKSS